MNTERRSYLPHKPSKETVKEGALHAGVYGTTVSAGAVLGVATANQIAAPHVQLSRFAEVQPTLDFGGKGLEVTYGSTMHLPNTLQNLPHMGVDINITQLSASVDDPSSFKELASLAAQYKPNIAEPIQHAMMERLALGATLGAAALTAVGYFALKKYKERPEKVNIKQHWDRLKNSDMKTKAVAGLVGIVALLGAGKVTEGTVSASNGTGQVIVKRPLPQAITEKSPMLKDAWMEGFGSELPQKAFSAFVEYKKNVEEELDISKKAFEEQFKAYQAKNSSLINNPNYRVAMHVSDAHCNYAMFKKGLEPVVEAFQPSTIFNSGDTYTNTGTMPYEKNCFTDFRAAVAKGNEKATIINTIGNHDPKNFINIDSDPKVITPTEDDHYTTESEFGKVVVTPDESKVLWQSIPEEKTVDMYELVAKQSAKTEEQACKVTEEDGREPIVMVHRPQVSFGTTLKGCASLILKGHTHKNQKLKNVLSDSGQEVTHHTAGSMSGTGNTIAIYETPKKPATFSVLYFDDANELRGATTVTFFPGGDVKIEDEKMPKKIDKDLNSAVRTPLKEAVTLKK